MGNEEKKSRFRIEVREQSGGGLFELEVTTTYYIIENKTESIVMQFSHESSSTFEAGQWAHESSGGVTKIEISEDEKFALVYQSWKEEPEKIVLPEAIS